MSSQQPWAVLLLVAASPFVLDVGILATSLQLPNPTVADQGVQPRRVELAAPPSLPPATCHAPPPP